ncbi:MAG: Nucleotidyl transferase [Segetibacter sp.]|nr:Nucleotidyl transferase [Segetibacter sp.]
MILAAGLGTRLKPWTDQHPKALALVNGKSLLQRNIEYLQQFGIKEVVVNVHHFADQIVAALEKNKGWGSAIVISDETDAVLETGGGLIKAAPLLTDSDPFVLMNVDILTDLDLDAVFEYHDTHNPLATLAVSDRQTSRYFLFDEEDTLCGWRNIKTGEEKPATQPGSKNKKQKAFSGIHIISPAIFSLITLQGKFSMVDVYLDLMQEHEIKGYDHTGTRFLDVGKPESISKAEALWKD